MHLEQSCAGPARSTRLVRHKKQVHNQRFGLNFDASKALKLPVLSLNTAINSSTAHTLSFPLSNFRDLCKSLLHAHRWDSLQADTQEPRIGLKLRLHSRKLSHVPVAPNKSAVKECGLLCRSPDEKLPGRAAVSVS